MMKCDVRSRKIKIKIKQSLDKKEFFFHPTKKKIRK